MAVFVLPSTTRTLYSADPELAHLTRLVHGRLTGWFYRSRYRLVAKLLEPAGSALEIGYGMGLFAPTLASVAQRVFGIDVHDEAGQVKDFLTGLGIKITALQRATALHLPFRDYSFDTVVAISVLEHLVDLEAAFREITRVCKPGGQVLLGIPTKNSITRLLIRFLGYDDALIHPSSHEEILATAQRYLILETTCHFPRLLSVDRSLYLAARLRRGWSSVRLTRSRSREHSIQAVEEC